MIDDAIMLTIRNSTTLRIILFFIFFFLICIIGMIKNQNNKINDLEEKYLKK